MKKILTLGVVFAFASFGLQSCDEWEDESYHSSGTGPGEEETGIVGVWKLTSLEIGEPFDFNGDGSASTDLMAETDCYQDEFINFNADFTGLGISNSYAEVNIEDEVFSVECIEESDETSFVWLQEQNTIAMNLGDDTITATLNGNKLTYMIPEGFMVTNPEGDEVEILQNITFIYTKEE